MPEASLFLRQGGVYLQQPEQTLLSLLQSIPAAELAGWKAFFLEAPVKVKKLSAWQDVRLATIAFQQLIATGLFIEEPSIFFFDDASLVLLCKNLTVDAFNFNDIRHHIDQTLLEGALSRAWKTYDLGNDAPELVRLCEHKLAQHARQEEPAALDESPFQSPAFAQNIARRPHRLRPEILVIEDDAATGKLIVHLLKDYTVRLASTAQEGAIAYAIHFPDIVFLDIGLPGVNGLEFLKILRRYDAGAFVVMLTANSSRENLDHAIGLGAQGFMAKPFTLQKILQYIAKKEKH